MPSLGCDLDTSCIILAGGKSVRLGRDKVLEKVDNRSLLEQVISSVESLVREIIVVIGEDKAIPQIAGLPNVKVVADIYPGKGSLGGIYTGLVRSNSLYNLVVASDMPFLNRSLLSYMIGVAEGLDYVLPRVNNFYEPLHAIYSKTCIGPMENMIKEGRKVIIELIDRVKVGYIEAEEIERFDPRHLSFFNINTKEDLELARSIAAGSCN